VVGELWETLLEERMPSALLQSRFRTLYPHVVGACVEAVQLVCKAAGGRAVYITVSSNAVCAMSWR